MDFDWSRLGALAPIHHRAWNLNHLKRSNALNRRNSDRLNQFKLNPQKAAKWRACSRHRLKRSSRCA